MTIRYGAPIMSSIVGSHHALFNQSDGLIKQPAAPRHPPTIEMVAAGFLRLIHEHTVILLKTITPAARANSKHAINQRKCDPISTRERARSDFLSCKLAKPGRLSGKVEELSQSRNLAANHANKRESTDVSSQFVPFAFIRGQKFLAFLRRFRHYL